MKEGIDLNTPVRPNEITLVYRELEKKAKKKLGYGESNPGLLSPEDVILSLRVSDVTATPYPIESCMIPI